MEIMNIPRITGIMNFVIFLKESLANISLMDIPFFIATQTDIPLNNKRFINGIVDSPHTPKKVITA